MTDKDTAAIDSEIKEFNTVHQQYVDTKLRLIKQQDLPFDPSEFYNAQD